jgi:hypothetical protein
VRPTLDRPRDWLSAGIGFAALLPLACAAAPALTVSGTAQYEVNSNVYDLAGGVPVPGTADTRHSDNLQEYRGSFLATYQLGEQNVYANLHAGEFLYDRFTILNHTEYSIDAGLNWEALRTLTGSFDVTRSRSMVAFNTLVEQQQQPALQTEQRETAVIRYLVTPDWRLDTDVYTRTVDSPVPTAANLNLKESSADLALKYVRDAKLTEGFDVGYLTGEYDGVAAANLSQTYHQANAGLVVNYAASGLSSFTGQAGYTRRSSALGTNDLSGATGSLDYKRNLTAKTSIDLLLSRAISSNVANDSSEIDGTASGTIKWQATYRIGIQANITYLNRFLPNQGVPLGTDRRDHQITGALNLNYEVLRWLTIAPYANVQSRTSNTIDGGYNATVYGVNVTGRWKN